MSSPNAILNSVHLISYYTQVLCRHTGDKGFFSLNELLYGMFWSCFKFLCHFFLIHELSLALFPSHCMLIKWGQFSSPTTTTTPNKKNVIVISWYWSVFSLSLPILETAYPEKMMLSCHFLHIIKTLQQQKVSLQLTIAVPSNLRWSIQ